MEINFPKPIFKTSHPHSWDIKSDAQTTFHCRWQQQTMKPSPTCNGRCWLLVRSFFPTVLRWGFSILLNTLKTAPIDQSKLTNKFESSMTSTSFIFINLQWSCVEDGETLLQKSGWEMMLTWRALMMEMETHRWIRELSESKSAELDDKLEMWGEVRKRGIKCDSRKLEKRHVCEGRSWIQSCIYWVWKASVSSKTSHTDNWAFDSRT